MCSLHAAVDYPFLSPDEPWALPLRAGASVQDYLVQLRAALARRPADCGALVVSLGFDTLATDPDAQVRKTPGWPRSWANCSLL
jgi:acetoin utilization deacetylase AcuC-like enzyme